MYETRKNIRCPDLSDQQTVVGSAKLHSMNRTWWTDTRCLNILRILVLWKSIGNWQYVEEEAIPFAIGATLGRLKRSGKPLNRPYVQRLHGSTPKPRVNPQDRRRWRRRKKITRTKALNINSTLKQAAKFVYSLCNLKRTLLKYLYWVWSSSRYTIYSMVWSNYEYLLLRLRLP